MPRTMVNCSIASRAPRTFGGATCLLPAERDDQHAMLLSYNKRNLTCLGDIHWGRGREDSNTDPTESPSGHKSCVVEGSRLHGRTQHEPDQTKENGCFSRILVGDESSQQRS
jgi:hypothetical protein